MLINTWDYFSFHFLSQQPAGFVAGDGKIAAEELQAGLAEKFDIVLSDEVAAAIVTRYNAAAHGQPPAFDFRSFAAMYDGTFSQYVTSSIGMKG